MRLVCQPGALNLLKRVCALTGDFITSALPSSTEGKR